ncbi:MAG: hypothetical protein ABJG32_08000, partial [Roseibium sp.]
MAELGITELDLTADASNIELSDGSVITGKTTFTRSDGTTGTVGDMLLASEAEGHRVVQVKAANGDRPVCGRRRRRDLRAGRQRARRQVETGTLNQNRRGI